jgi:diguanylate cyclase (GGDEF)-like protein
VISIKKFLSQNDTEEDRTPLHVVRILVQGIGEHAAPGDTDDCARFRESMEAVAGALVDEIAPEELLVQAGFVLKGLEDHSRRALRHHTLQTAELQNMLKMLTSTVGTISEASKSNASILSDIEKHVSVTSELNDVRVMKAKLADCLIDIRKEVERQRAETTKIIQELRVDLEQVRHDSPVDKGTDAITGLPLRPEAEAALAEASRASSRNYAAIVVIDRLQTLNARFGREAGDEIMIAFIRIFQKQLNSKDRMFRWGGPALLALLPRQASFELVRGEMSRIMEMKMEHTIQIASRTVLIPIAVRWCLLPMMTVSRLMYQKIDEFAAGPITRGEPVKGEKIRV